MSPLGDETGLLVLFGVSTIAVLALSIRLRARPRAVLSSTVAGVVCALALYAVIAVLSLLVRGTGGYQFATWLVLAAAGLAPAAAVGLVQGFVAGLILRLFR